MRHSPEDYNSLEPMQDVPEYCEVVIYEHSSDGVAPDLKAPCGVEILTMAYKGTGACGEEHLKIKTRDYGTKQVPVNPTGEC